MGGTFTVSNLGMYGIKQFAAIVNPPQVRMGGYIHGKCCTGIRAGYQFRSRRDPRALASTRV